MRRLLPLLVCVFTWLPATARAEEPQGDETAAAIGRGLLSPRTEERRAAQARLLARVLEGGDLEGFLRAMSEGVAAWANQNERLMEVWLHQAVHGDAAEREQAVRLLATLGAPAMRRLALELRHRIRHDGETGIPEPGPEDAPAAGAAVDAPSSVPGEPRLYEMKDLAQGGMNPLALRSFLQKAADAHEVKQHGTTWIVTAAPRGHEQLIASLHALRQARASSQAGADEARPAAPAPAPAPAPAGQKAMPPPTPAKTPQEAPPPPAAALPARPGGEAALPSLWRVHAVFVHVPEQAGLPLAWRDAPLQVGTLQEVGDWSQIARRMPEARGEEPSGGQGPLKLGDELDAFSGRELRYSKDVQRTKGGAWRLVTGTIQHGLGLRLRMTPGDGGVRVALAVRRTEVGLPILVIKVKPSFDAAAVELERPEWSTTTSRAAFDLPVEGGGALLSLEGLTSPGGDRVLLVVTLRPLPQ